MIPEEVREVMRTLETAGHEVWCVGGCVRDRLLGTEPEDWDAATSAHPREVMALFGARAFPTGLKHGTVTVRTGSRGVEITTYRRDGDYLDHRRPDSVTFTGSLTEDLQRRDFTVNAMAMNRSGVLRDPFGGEKDLRDRVLRCVGVPDARFHEDALRMMRGLRFSSVLNLTIDAGTAESIHKNRALLGEIAPERIQTELFKLLPGRRAAEVLREFPDVIGVFWPEILPMVGFDQKNIHHNYDVWEHSLHALEAVPPEAMLRCVMLLHDVGKPAVFTVDPNGVGHFIGHQAVSARYADEMLRRLRCANAVREEIVRLIEWHDRDIPRTDRGIRRALNALGEEELRKLILVKRADNLAQAPQFHLRQREIDRAEEILDRLMEESTCFTLKQMEINGRDLEAMGVRGKDVGRGLNVLLERVLDGEVPNEREKLLLEARALFRK